jgi:hypothetical protein
MVRDVVGCTGVVFEFHHAKSPRSKGIAVGIMGPTVTDVDRLWVVKRHGHDRGTGARYGVRTKLAWCVFVRVWPSALQRSLCHIQHPGWNGMTRSTLVTYDKPRGRWLHGRAPTRCHLQGSMLTLGEWPGGIIRVERTRDGLRLLEGVGEIRDGLRLLVREGGTRDGLRLLARVGWSGMVS